MDKKHFFNKSNLVMFSLIVAVVLVSLALSYSGRGSVVEVTEAAGGTIVTEHVPAFGCDIGPICGGSCTGVFRQNGQGTGWNVSQGFRKIQITNNDSSRPHVQTLSIFPVRVDVDDDGYGDGWSKDTCRGGGGPFCGHSTGDNCAGTIYPTNGFWNASAADTRTHITIDGTAINKLAPNGTTGIWGGFNAYYVVQTLVCSDGLVVGGSNHNRCVQSPTPTPVPTLNPTPTPTVSITPFPPTPTPVIPTVTPCISLPNIGCIPKIPTPTPLPTIVITPFPKTPSPIPTTTFGPVVCAPAFRAVPVGQLAAFLASGGSGSYQWFAQDGAPFTSIGSFFTTVYSTAGNGRLVRVFDTVTGNTASCVVNVSAINNPTQTPTRTPTPLPTVSGSPAPTPSTTPTQTIAPTPTPTFSTTPTSTHAPVVETRAATSVAKNAARINSNINPNGFITAGWFEFGRTVNLGQKTNSQTVGNGFAFQSFAGTLSGLAANTTYYYRVVAQNQFGFSYGAILSFKTLASGATPSPTVSVSPTPTTTPSGELDISCLTLVPSLSPESPDQGQEFTYSILYRNDCSADFPNVVLKVTLPAETTFKSANLPYSAEAGNNFSFTLGNVTKGFSSTLEVKGIVNDSANDGDTIIFTSVLNLTDSNGKFRSVVSTLSDTIGDGEVAGITSDISNALGAGGWWWILFVILILVLIFLVYLLLSERSRRAEYRRQVVINNTPPQPPQYYR